MAFRTLLGKTNVPTIKALVVSFGLVVGFGFVSTGAGCGASLGTECTLTSDCTEGLICVFGMCVEQCNKSIDCRSLDENAICVKAEGPQLANDSTMTSVNACHKPQPCGDQNNGLTCEFGQVCRENRCWRRCSGLDACPDGEECIQNACRPEVKGTDGHRETMAIEGDYCEINSDCSTLLCSTNSKCRKCRVRGDCFLGAECYSGNCVDLRGNFETSGTASTSSGAGVGALYATCGECLSRNSGAGPSAFNTECASLWKACSENTACTGIADCVLNGGGSNPGACSLDMCGTDCTQNCKANFASSNEDARRLFDALDKCVNCTVCRDVCTNIEFGGDQNANAYCNGMGY